MLTSIILTIAVIVLFDDTNGLHIPSTIAATVLASASRIVWR